MTLMAQTIFIFAVLFFKIFAFPTRFVSHYSCRRALYAWIRICILGRSVLGKTVPEVLGTAGYTRFENGCSENSTQKLLTKYSMEENKHVISRPRSVRIGKKYALGLGYGPLPAALGRTQDLWHSFSQYGPPGRQITYMYKPLRSLWVKQAKQYRQKTSPKSYKPEINSG